MLGEPVPPLVLQKLLTESLGELDAAVTAACKSLQAVGADLDLRRVFPFIRIFHIASDILMKNAIYYYDAFR